MLAKHYLINYKQLLESTQTTAIKPYLLSSKDTIYPLGTMLSYCHVFLTFSQTSPFITYFILFNIIHLYLPYLLADAARREARGPVAVRNPGKGKQIKGIKKIDHNRPL